VEIQRTYDIYLCMRGYKGVEIVEIEEVGINVVVV